MVIPINDLKKHMLKLCLQGPQILNDFRYELRKYEDIKQSDVQNILNILVMNGFLVKKSEKRLFPEGQGDGEYTITVYSLTVDGHRHASG